MTEPNVKFEDALSDEDFGLIICGKTGNLKGLWIPEGMEDDPVPESIIEICCNVFGIDRAEFDDEYANQTIH